MNVLDDITVNFAWIELSSLCYELCFNINHGDLLSQLFNKLLMLAKKETDQRMGELLRILFPILSLYQEGRKIEDKATRKSNQLLLDILNRNDDPCFFNCKYALFQRIFIVFPDKADDKKNCTNTALSILSHIPFKERARYHQWLTKASLCNAFNVRLCSIFVSKGLLTSEYLNATRTQVEEGEKEDEEEEFVQEGGVSRGSLEKMDVQLFQIILDRCEDITISIRTECVKVFYFISFHLILFGFV